MKKQLLFILSILFLVSCGSISSSMKVESKIREIELEMPKKQVIDIMGKHYTTMQASITPWGDKFESIGYEVYDGSLYVLLFKNGKLAAWHKEPTNINQYPQRSNIDPKQRFENQGSKSHLDSHRKAILSTANSEAQKAAINAHMDAHEKAVLGH